MVVGALPFGRPYLLPVAIGRLVAKHPQLQVRTVEAPLDALVAGLRLGDVDFLLGALQSEQPGDDLVREELSQEPMTLLVRTGHPLAKRKGLQLADVLEGAWVLPRRGTPTRDALCAHRPTRVARAERGRGVVGPVDHPRPAAGNRHDLRGLAPAVPA
ncbi:hypothetical protein HK414_26180 [Ramlibacter terrae]|uniref:LysR substrate-binding domain-containing protein n=1 Tax=Ramlibacter terrae TaxID=2732511 RepID=A0ABX6P611_9BURK|nr:hypothetical protein HK414_26180 [Ramlibacter terrae]